jgi:hypothetical protein
VDYSWVLSETGLFYFISNYKFIKKHKGTTQIHMKYTRETLLRTYVRRGKRGQEVKEDLARVQGETTGGG